MLTSSHLNQTLNTHQAASIALTALSKNDAGPDTTVLDMGCGVGILGIALALVQSDLVYLLDCDEDALALARRNVDYLMEEELLLDDDDGYSCCVEMLRAKVRYVKDTKNDGAGDKRGNRHHSRGGRGRGGRGSIRPRGRGNKARGGSNTQQSQQQQTQSLQSSATTTCEDQPNNKMLDLNDDDGIPLPSKIVDTVITNPPFGTKNNEGIDIQFLKACIRLARRAVYSFHKTSTRPHLMKVISSWGYQVEVVAEMKFDIENMYKFHKEKVKDVDVDLIRVFVME